MDPIELACRALCRYNNVFPDSEIAGAPAWHSYRSEVMALISALRTGDELPRGMRLEPRHKPSRTSAAPQWA